MFALHFRRRADSRDDFVRIEPYCPVVIGTQNGLTSLESAREARKVSGDLVVDLRTGLVVDNEDWLWDWEKNDPTCYARRAMEMDRTFAKTLARN